MSENGKIRFPESDNPSLPPPTGSYYVWLSTDGFFKKMDSAGNVTNLSAQSIGDMTDVDLTGLQDGQVLVWNQATSTWIPADMSGGGVGTFVELTDTPSQYTGMAGKVATVNQAENALEFTDKLPADGFVESVNGETGVVVLDPDDLDDSTTAHKFVSQEQLDDIAKIDTIEGQVNAIDNTKVLDENDFVVAQGLDKTLNLPEGSRITFASNNSSMVRIGEQSGEGDNDDDSAVSIGFRANGGIASKANSVAIGTQSGYNSSGSGNVNLGVNTGSFGTGNFNTHIGNSAGQNRASASNNVCVGPSTGYNRSGNSNIYLGDKAGGRSSAGNPESDTIRIGKQSDFDAEDELIVGDMASKQLTINGGMT